ncbi:AcrB/AcrD/AcrF family, partial [Popillia japonica]
MRQTAAVCDSMRHLLMNDDRVLSVTSFVGTSSPRFNSGYSPNMPSKNYGQFIVNTKSNEATQEVENTYIPTAAGEAVPLRQIATVSADWREGQINRRNGVFTVTVRADLKRGENANTVQVKVSKIVDEVKSKPEYNGVNIAYGGLAGSDSETTPRIFSALMIAVFIIYLILVFHYKKISLANLTLASTALCLFGAAFGIWITGHE